MAFSSNRPCKGEVGKVGWGDVMAAMWGLSNHTPSQREGYDGAKTPSLDG